MELEGQMSQQTSKHIPSSQLAPPPPVFIPTTEMMAAKTNTDLKSIRHQSRLEI